MKQQEKCISNTSCYSISRITKKVAEEWVVKKHYSRKMSIFWEAYGLFLEGNLQGVCVFGQPSPPIQKYAFKDRDFKLYELTRLVVQVTPDKLKNAASILISGALSMLKTPCAVVSYADMEFNHCGIVYQATNWIYTGGTKSHDHTYLINGEKVKPITLRDKYGVTNPKQWAKENGIETVPPMIKHRYFYICGNKRDRFRIRNMLKYPEITPYPKCNQKRYDTGEPIVTTQISF